IQADTVSRILVYNKIDLIADVQPKIDRDEQGRIVRVFISAAKNMGMKELAIAIGEMLHRNMVTEEVVLLPEQGKLRAELYSAQAVTTEKIDDQGCYHLFLNMPKVEFDRIFSHKKS